MDLAEMGEHVLGAEPDRAAAARMVPARRVGRDLQVLDRRPGGGKRRQGVRLASNASTGAPASRHSFFAVRP